MLTEQEVSRSWQALFCKGAAVDKSTFAKAEAMLDELRSESPLRHRLGAELTELKHLHQPPEKKKAPRKRRVAAT